MRDARDSRVSFEVVVKSPATSATSYRIRAEPTTKRSECAFILIFKRCSGYLSLCVVTLVAEHVDKHIVCSPKHTDVYTARRPMMMSRLKQGDRRPNPRGHIKSSSRKSG